MLCRSLWAALFAVGIAAVSSAEDRVALVIGNGGYEGAAALKNPTNDAEAMAGALAKLDFKVIKKTDVDLAQMEDAVVAFRKSLKKNSVAFFFYAGHGVQVKGENFLLPLKANLKEEFQVKEKCYKLDQVLAALDDSEAALKLVVLDCCRDNPFTRGWTRGAQSKGLASIDVPNGTIIAFSTAPGQTALDGRGANSPYTAQLVASLGSRPKDGLEVKAAFFAASRAVFKEVGQRPWINLDGSLDDHYLWKGVSPAEVMRTTLLKLRAEFPEVGVGWSGLGSLTSFAMNDDHLEPKQFAVYAEDIAAGKIRPLFNLTASTVKKIRPLPPIEFECDLFLTADEAVLTERHVDLLAKFAKLTHLSIQCQQKLSVEPKAAAKLADLRSLQELTLFHFEHALEFTAADFTALARAPALEYISLFGKLSPQSTAGIASLSTSRSLKVLNCEGCEVTGELTQQLKLLKERNSRLSITQPTQEPSPPAP